MGSTSIPGAGKRETMQAAIAELGHIHAIAKVYNKRDRSTAIYTVVASSTSPTGRIIAVTLVEGSGRNWSWKHMDESQGPYVYDCPEVLFPMAGKPVNDYAAKWRERCRAKRSPELYPDHFYVAADMVDVRPSTSSIGYMVRGKFTPIPDLWDVMLRDGAYLTVTPNDVWLTRTMNSGDLMVSKVTERDARAFLASRRS